MSAGLQDLGMDEDDPSSAFFRTYMKGALASSGTWSLSADTLVLYTQEGNTFVLKRP